MWSAAAYLLQAALAGQTAEGVSRIPTSTADTHHMTLHPPQVNTRVCVFVCLRACVCVRVSVCVCVCVPAE